MMNQAKTQNTSGEPATRDEWSLEKVMALATGYWGAAALHAAVTLGLFDLVTKGPVTAASASAELQTSAANTVILLDALAALKILEKNGHQYDLEPSIAPFLRQDDPRCLVNALRYNNDLYPLWGQLATSVREGAPVVPPTAHLGDDPGRTRNFVLGMHSRATAIAPALLPSLDLEGRVNLLDVGSGPGTFSRGLAERHPELQTTLFDLPPVLEIARELTGDSPTAARVRFHPGNYRDDDWPAAGFDAALFCGALHQETPASAARVFEKIFAALAPRGRLYVVDMMLDDSRTQPEFSALFAITMMLSTASSNVFTGNEVCDLAAAAGFVEPQCHRPPHIPYWIVRADKPSAS